MVIRNNPVGKNEVSSGAISFEQDVTLAAGGDAQNSDTLNIQGLPRIAIQVESRDNTAQVVQIIVQGAIALLMSANNYVFANYNIALQYIRVNLTTAAGLAADCRVRICASQ